MRRREFITLFGGAAATWPMAARGQQGERIRRIGVLMNLTSDDPEGQSRLSAFAQALQQAGWTIGRNVRIEYRWGAGDPALYVKYASELVATTPDVILTNSADAVKALQGVTRALPIVFAQATDPVGAGIVETLARPGGNVTGFTGSEYGMSVKLLELLKAMVPTVTRVAVLRDAGVAGGPAQFAAIQAVAPSQGIELTPIGMRDGDEIQRAVASFAQGSRGGLIITNSTRALIHRNLIVALAARHRLPAAYPLREFVTEGGMIAYGPDRIDQYRRAAEYVDRILRGEKPADLPVQAPTKYELAINLKTTKALDLTVPNTILVSATEVIE